MVSYKNLFVTKFPRAVTDADLLAVFEKYNPISCKVMLDAQTGRSKGFGFVLFETAEAGEQAFTALNTKMAHHGRQTYPLCMYPSKHNGSTAATESTCLYVRNIPNSVSQDDVKMLLETFGTVAFFATRRDHLGCPVWVVFVEYDCLECSRKALAGLHGSRMYAGTVSAPILAKYADTKEAAQDRRARRNAKTLEHHESTDSCVPSGASDASGSSTMSTPATSLHASLCSLPASPDTIIVQHAPTAIPTAAACVPTVATCVMAMPAAQPAAAMMQIPMLAPTVTPLNLYSPPVGYPAAVEPAGYPVPTAYGATTSVVVPRTVGPAPVAATSSTATYQPEPPAPALAQFEEVCIAVEDTSYGCFDGSQSQVGEAALFSPSTTISIQAAASSTFAASSSTTSSSIRFFRHDPYSLSTNSIEVC